MSVALIVLALGGCHKEKQAATGSAAPPPPSGSAQLAVVQDAAIADAAASTSINLLHAVPSTIRVSSQVKNRAIKPEHIADGSLDTAWNSATGELKGAWIEVAVDGATIDSIKLTAGHTGHGAKGEDYFTMNPRIRAVKLDDDGKPLGTFPLDITKRELQTIRVAPQGTLRITVDDIEPGSKASWRETAISELEVWGTPAAGWTAPKQPLSPAVVVDGVVEQAPDPCADIEKDRAEMIKRENPYGQPCNGPGCEDHNYPPTCDSLELPQNLSELGAPWAGANANCPIGDETYGPKRCEIVFKAGGRVRSADFENDMAHAEIAVERMELVDAIPGGRNELMIVAKVNRDEQLVVCRDAPVLDCSNPVRVGASWFDSAANKEMSWTTHIAFDKGDVVLTKDQGEPDASHLGRHPLSFVPLPRHF